MTTPVLYADLPTLKLVLDSTDQGAGTAAQLSDAQLSQALQAGSNRVSVYAGVIYDPAAMPPIVADLTLDIAAWYATTFYLKQKGLPANHPVALRYTEAVKILESVRKGEISLDVATTTAASARIINRIPGVFTEHDSDTAFDPASGYQLTDTRPDEGPIGGLFGAWEMDT